MKTLILAAMLFCLSFSCAAVTKVVYQPAEADNDIRYRDIVEILQTAMAKTEAEYGPYLLEPRNSNMHEPRLLAELKSGQSVNVVWTSTSIEKEKEFRPIRIPLRKGLLGYRIAIIHHDKQAKIDQVKSLEDLTKLVVGQGTGWGDIAIYEANGINVQHEDYGALFRMLNAGRFDLFPRGIGEAFFEIEQWRDKNPNLAVEKGLLIHYPWPYYFFTSLRNEALAKRLEAGLRIMIADGSFERIFRKYNGESIQRANLKKRRIIPIRNHLLPPETPLDDGLLWFNPLK